MFLTFVGETEEELEVRSLGQGEPSSSTPEYTPYSDTLAYNQMKKENGLLFGAPCLHYGFEIQQNQEDGEEFLEDGNNDKIKYSRKRGDDDFQDKVCKMSLRLECIRDRFIPVSPPGKNLHRGFPIRPN
jgi:hypothetical protein